MAKVAEHSTEYDPVFGDYVALLKPRVMSLVVFTAFVGLMAAPVSLHPVESFCAILFIAIGGGASGSCDVPGVVGIGGARAARLSAREPSTTPLCASASPTSLLVTA